MCSRLLATVQEPYIAHLHRAQTCSALVLAARTSVDGATQDDGFCILAEHLHGEYPKTCIPLLNRLQDYQLNYLLLSSQLFIREQAMDEMEMTGTPWMPLPAQLHAYRQFECFQNTTADCEYYQGYWHFVRTPLILLAEAY